MNKSESEKNKEIIIDLKNTSNIIKNTIQPEAKDRLSEILDNFKKRNRNPTGVKETHAWRQDFYIERANNTIFINGERGAGKTTFLRSQLLSMLEDDGDEILPIALIDPTLVETHQHILVDIIAKLSELVRSELSCCGNESKHTKFNERLEAMAEGLRLLQSKEKSKDQDASWFLNKALRNAIGGQTLEQKFHELIDTSSEILKQNIFVIAFDDVDTDTTKAFEVLELIRRYLSHSKIVTLISGDIKLYSHIVKNKKIEEFSTKSNIEASITNELTDHLEQQYLAKVFPIDQRIELKNLFELSRNEKYTFKVDDASNLEPVELTELIEKIIQKTFSVYTKNDIKQYTQFFLQQPLRTILQTLKTLSVDQYESKSYSAQMAESMKCSYTGVFRNEKINAEDLTQVGADPTKIGLAMFGLCHRYGELETGFYGRPDSQDSNYNIAQFFLASVASNYLNPAKKKHSLALNNIGNCLSFMMAAGAPCNVFNNYVAENKKENSSIDDYINYLGMNRNQNIFSVSAHFSSLFFHGLKSGTSAKYLRAGVARTPRGVKLTKGIEVAVKKIYSFQKSIRVVSNIRRLDGQSADQPLLTKLAIEAILISSHSTITKAEGRDYVSIFCLLAGIAELATCENIEATLSKLTSLQTYAAPTFMEGIDVGSGDEEVEEDINQLEEGSAENNSEVIELIKKWQENLATENSVSPLLCGKIWTRFFYTTIKISEFKKIKIDKHTYDITLHEFISRLVLGLINSCLVEEIRYGGRQKSEAIVALRKAKNVAETPRELYQNIKNLRSAFESKEAAIEAIPITSSLIRCPLLWPFLVTHKDSAVNDFLLSVIDTVFENSNQYFLDTENPKVFISSLPIIGCNNSKTASSSALVQEVETGD